METYSLYQLNEFIRRFVALNLPQAIWVHAEIAEVDERRGHYYLSLIEKESEGGELVAKGQAMMWSQQAHKWQRKNKIILNDFYDDWMKDLSSSEKYGKFSPLKEVFAQLIGKATIDHGLLKWILLKPIMKTNNKKKKEAIEKNSN